MKNRKIGLRFTAFLVCMLVVVCLSTSVLAVFANDNNGGMIERRDTFDDHRDQDNFFDEDRGVPRPHTRETDPTDPEGDDSVVPDTDKDNDGGMDKEDGIPDDDADIADRDDKDDKEDKDIRDDKDEKDEKKFSYTGLIVAVIIAVAVIILIIVMIPSMNKSNKR
ncbi:MAG: hypothetical protein IIU77_01560 [Clostridia bacterium]|nr:hypothetical protein [Clostridia bacterium]